MNLEDPAVRRFSQSLLTLIVIFMLFISILTIWLVIDWDGVGSNNEYLAQLFITLPKLSGEKISDFINLAAIFIGAIPLILSSVCFKSINGNKNLNKFGVAMLTAISLSLIFSAIAYVFINPKLWGDGHSLGSEGLTHAQQWAKIVLNTSVAYISTLLGIKALK